MRRLNATFGETPRALLAITLAASLYTDTANALILAALFRWLGAQLEAARPWFGRKPALVA